MPSPTGYRITFNVFNDSPTGHVNVTFTGPDGQPQTFGNNTNNGEWGVRVENLVGRNYFSTHHDVTAEQFFASRNLVSEIIGGDQNSYGLIFRNCVDFVRKVAAFGGLGTDISSLFQWVDTPVNYYASITD